MSDKKPVSKKIVGLADDAVKTIDKYESPKMSLPVRSLSNVSFDEKEGFIKLGDKRQTRTFFNIGQAKKYMQGVLIASACKELIDTGKTTSIRDLYYMTKHTIADKS